MRSSFHPIRIARMLSTLLALLALASSSTATLADQTQAASGVYLPLARSIGTTATSARWVSAYYVGYQRDLLPPDQIDWSTLTHLMVGRITPTVSGGVTTNFDIDDIQGPQLARDLAQRAHAAGRKAILMLGGAGEHAGFVGAASAQNRAAFGPQPGRRDR